jgi:ribonuclease HII
MISGVDEAGKGPVLGPMCVAGVMVEERKLGELALLGVKDSKKLSAKRREELAEDIKKLANKCFILEVSPNRIDELRKVMTMNEIMVLCFSNVLEELRPGHAFLDAADVNEARFGENVRKKYGREIDITSEHKADENYPVVSAASILAKVERDALVKKLEDLTQELRSEAVIPLTRRPYIFLKNM